MRLIQVGPVALLLLQFHLATNLVDAGVALANGAEVISSGATLVPVHSTGVQLDMESVHVDMPTPLGLGGQVSCTYHLRNVTDADASLTMAFVTGNETNRLSDASIYRDSRFHVLANWQEIPSRLQAANTTAWTEVTESSPDSLWVWELTIPAGARTMLEITYEVWPGYRSDGDRTWYTFRYHARPAALWAGEVNVAEFSFSLGSMGGPLLECLLQHTDCVASEITPPGYTWGPRGIEWRFRNWEPDRDFEVSLLLPETAAQETP